VLLTKEELPRINCLRRDSSPSGGVFAASSVAAATREVMDMPQMKVRIRRRNFIFALLGWRGAAGKFERMSTTN
jgi:hypothetical protein